MVNEETIMKKKKKKKRQSDIAGLDESIRKKKKRIIKKSEDGAKKKKKRKKSLKNSTMIFDPPEPLPDSQEDPPVAESDEELFGSQSPAPSPIKSQQSPVKSQESPASPGSQNGLSEDDSDAELLETPVKITPVKRPATSRPSPVMKFAKKTKIVNNKLNTEESPKKKVEVEESDASGAEEDDVIAPLPLKEEVKHIAAPLSDPVISQQEQDRRDLTLLIQIKEKFPDTLVKDINWNNLFVFSMKPDDMASRYEILLNNIPREKSNCTLVNEALLSICNSKVREIPLTQRGQFPSSATQNWNMKKKLNAFSLFSSNFDLKKISREEVKEQWEALDKNEKKRLKAEARALNNIHGIQSGVKPKPRPISAYQVFSKEHMNLGMKMTEIGPKWKTLDEDKKKEYQTIADDTNRERKESSNEQSSPP